MMNSHHYTNYYKICSQYGFKSPDPQALSFSLFLSVITFIPLLPVTKSIFSYSLSHSFGVSITNTHQ